jgi:putative ABC transport system permease protein
MIRHLLKLVWNRRRSSLLIAIEILLSFIVVAAVATLAVFYLDNYRRPLGFDVERIWTVTLEMNEEGRTSLTVESNGEATPPLQSDVSARRRERRALVRQLLLTLRDMPEVEAVAGAAVTPYSGNSWESDIEVGGRRHRFGGSAGTDEFARVMGLTITRGRWFSKDDDPAAWRPVVINARLAAEMFGERDPIGQFITEAPPGKTAPDPASRMRVVGVITDFRKDGEYASAENFLFTRARLDEGDTSEAEPVREIVIRVKPGAAPDFEERAVALLRRGAPDWTFQAEPLPKSRETALRFWLAPLAAAAIVSLFLLIMVAMGLSGVLWLHVTQRTHEVGLRRAKGATIVNIRRQLVGEVVVLTSVACFVGIAIIAQLPLLEVFPAVRPTVYGISVGISLLGIYVLAMSCAWTPANLAGAVQPAEALRYE